MVSFSLCLTSLSMIISSCICVHVNDIISSFLWLSSIPSYIRTTSLSIPLGLLPYWTLRLLSCLGYYNSAAMHIRVHISIQIMFSLAICPGVGLQGFYGSSTSRFSRFESLTSNVGGNFFLKEAVDVHQASIPRSSETSSHQHLEVNMPEPKLVTCRSNTTFFILRFLPSPSPNTRPGSGQLLIVLFRRTDEQLFYALDEQG